ncbi:SIS domain-containing protein, partial [bacterium]|nr:SIS domain-containing protein [bacterium]
MAKHFAKVVSLLITLSFVFPYLTWAFEKDTFPAGEREVLFNSQVLAIPGKFGAVTKSHQGQDKLIVYIQDLHCHEEVQTNIAGIIDYLSKKYGLKMVGVEGASGRIDVSKLSGFPQAKVKAEVGRYFMKQGKITGPEYYAAIGKQRIHLEGIETQKYYQANQEGVKRFLNNESQGYVYDLREMLEELKVQVYGKALRKHDQQRTRFRGGEQSLLSYAVYLYRAGRNAGLGMEIFPHLARYVSRRRNILPMNVDSDALYKEMERVERELRSGLYRSGQEQGLDDLHYRLDVIEKLVNISISPGELEAYRAQPEKFRVRVFRDFIQSFEAGCDWWRDNELCRLDEYLKEAEIFYQVADRRSLCFVENTLNRMVDYQTQLAVLVTGGYHSEEVLKELQHRDISYVCVKPELRHSDIVNPYFSLLKNQRTPLEKLLAQNQNLLGLATCFRTKAETMAGVKNILPENVKTFEKTLDLTLKLGLVIHLMREGVNGLVALKQTYKDIVAAYRENNSRIGFDWDNVRLAGRMGFCPVTGGFTAVICPCGFQSRNRPLLTVALNKEYEIQMMTSDVAADMWAKAGCADREAGGVLTAEMLRLGWHGPISALVLGVLKSLFMLPLIPSLQMVFKGATPGAEPTKIPERRVRKIEPAKDEGFPQLSIKIPGDEIKEISGEERKELELVGEISATADEFIQHMQNQVVPALSSSENARIIQEFDQALQVAMANSGRLYLVATGRSGEAVEYFRAYCNEAGFHRVSMLSPTSLDTVREVGEHDLVLFVSGSGSTLSILDAIMKIDRESQGKARFFGITADRTRVLNHEDLKPAWEKVKIIEMPASTKETTGDKKTRLYLGTGFELAVLFVATAIIRASERKQSIEELSEVVSGMMLELEYGLIKKLPQKQSVSLVQTLTSAGRKHENVVVLGASRSGNVVELFKQRLNNIFINTINGFKDPEAFLQAEVLVIVSRSGKTREVWKKTKQARAKRGKDIKIILITSQDSLDSSIAKLADITIPLAVKMPKAEELSVIETQLKGLMSLGEREKSSDFERMAAVYLAGVFAACMQELGLTEEAVRDGHAQDSSGLFKKVSTSLITETEYTWDINIAALAVTLQLQNVAISQKINRLKFEDVYELSEKISNISETSGKIYLIAEGATLSVLKHFGMRLASRGFKDIIIVSSIEPVPVFQKGDIALAVCNLADAPEVKENIRIFREAGGKVYEIGAGEKEFEVSRNMMTIPAGDDVQFDVLLDLLLEAVVENIGLPSADKKGFGIKSKTFTNRIMDKIKKSCDRESLKNILKLGGDIYQAYRNKHKIFILGTRRDGAVAEWLARTLKKLGFIVGNMQTDILEKGQVVLAISESGETGATLQDVRRAKQAGLKVWALTSVKAADSQLAALANESIYLQNIVSSKIGRLPSHSTFEITALTVMANTLVQAEKTQLCRESQSKSEKLESDSLSPFSWQDSLKTAYLLMFSGIFLGWLPVLLGSMDVYAVITLISQPGLIFITAALLLGVALAGLALIPSIKDKFTALWPLLYPISAAFLGASIPGMFFAPASLFPAGILMPPGIILIMAGSLLGAGVFSILALASRTDMLLPLWQDIKRIEDWLITILPIRGSPLPVWLNPHFSRFPPINPADPQNPDPAYSLDGKIYIQQSILDTRPTLILLAYYSHGFLHVCLGALKKKLKVKLGEKEEGIVFGILAAPFILLQLVGLGMVLQAMPYLSAPLFIALLTWMLVWPGYILLEKVIFSSLAWILKRGVLAYLVPLGIIGLGLQIPALLPLSIPISILSSALVMAGLAPIIVNLRNRIQNRPARTWFGINSLKFSKTKALAYDYAFSRQYQPWRFSLKDNIAFMKKHRVIAVVCAVAGLGFGMAFMSIFWFMPLVGIFIGLLIPYLAYVFQNFFLYAATANMAEAEFVRENQNPEKVEKLVAYYKLRYEKAGSIERLGMNLQALQVRLSLLMPIPMGIARFALGRGLIFFMSYYFAADLINLLPLNISGGSV